MQPTLHMEHLHRDNMLRSAFKNKGLSFTAAKQQVQHKSEQANTNIFLKKEKM